MTPDARRLDALTRTRYASRYESVAAARRHVDGTLDGIPSETRSAVVLMVSELATNAVRHTNSATFEVAVQQTAERVRVCVTDDGGGTPVVRAPSVTELSGRGLRIVLQLSDRFGIELSRDTTSVWFEVTTGSHLPGARDDAREAVRSVAPDTTDHRWIGIDTVDRLAEYVSSRMVDLGAAATAVAVVDVLDDPHVSSVPGTVPEHVAAALRSVVRDYAGSNVLELPDAVAATTWHVRALTLERRTVGAVAWLSPSGARSDDLPSALADDLAVAIDVVATRMSSRRLRKGLHAIRSIGADISRALSAQDVATSAEREAKAALGANACYLYRLAPAGLELVVADRHEGEPWRLIPLERSTPVTDCVRERSAVTCSSRRALIERYPWVSEHVGVDDQAWAAFPLELDRRYVGALFFSCAEPRTWTADELDVAATIADQCAQALARVTLQDQLDALRDERSELRFRAALDVMADLVAIESAVRDDADHIVDFRIEYMNRADIDVAGRETGDLTGRRLSDAYPAAAATELLARFAEVVETGRMLVVDELPYSDTIDGRLVRGTYRMQAAKFGDGVIVSARRTVSDNDAEPES